MHFDKFHRKAKEFHIGLLAQGFVLVLSKAQRGSSLLGAVCLESVYLNPLSLSLNRAFNRMKITP